MSLKSLEARRRRRKREREEICERTLLADPVDDGEGDECCNEPTFHPFISKPDPRFLGQGKPFFLLPSFISPPCIVLSMITTP